MNRSSTPCLALALILLSWVAGFAQQLGLQPLGGVAPGPIRPPMAKPIDSLILLKGGAIDVRAVTPQANAARTTQGLQRLGQTAKQPSYYLVHTALPATAALMARFRALGGQPVSIVPRNTWIVRATGQASAAIAALPEVDLVALYHPVYRISPDLTAKLQQAPARVTVNVVLFNGEDVAAARAAFTALGAADVSQSNGAYGPRLRMTLPGAAVAGLANMPGVQWVEERVPFKLHNDAGTGFGIVTGIPDGPSPGTADGLMNVAPVWTQGLDGSGIVVGHSDTGLDLGVTDASLHPDFYNSPSRVTGFAWGRTTQTLSRQPAINYTDNQPHQQDAHRFQAGVASVVSRITVRVGFGPTTSGLITCSLWNGDATAPTTQRVASSTTYSIPLSSLGSGTYTIPFDFVTGGQTPLTPGSYYWIVLDRTSGGSALVGTMGPGVDWPGGVRKSRANTASAWGNPPLPNTNEDLLSYAVSGLPPGEWSDADGHGTHTAGSVLGSGTASSVPGQYRGSAYAASLVHQSTEDALGSLSGIPDNIGDLFEQTRLLGANIHSDSWGSSMAGDYTTDAENLDVYVWNNPEFLPIFSAGNDGIDNSPANGVIDAGSMGSPATAKNCLTVGASESVRAAQGLNRTWNSAWPSDYPLNPIASDHLSNNYNGMAAFSSRGPCDDLRIKPDVVGPGTNTVSSRSKHPDVVAQSSPGWGAYPADPDYMYSGGTSMSCPLVAGATALVQEYFVEQRSHSPSAALKKATLIHGATDMAPGQYGTGSTQELQQVPDNSQGWGRVNLYRSLFPVTHGVNGNYLDATAANGQALNNGGGGQSRVAKVLVSGNGQPVKATLAWSDPPANAAGVGGLINDLELRVYRLGVDGTTREATYLPKQVGGATGDDSINNVEQVEVAGGSLVVGRYYEIEVMTTSLLNAAYSTQPFALVVTGIFTGPTPASISNWRAARRDGAARLSWEVSEGTDVAGFRVLRSSSPDGPFEPVNARLLRAREGQESYEYVDFTAPAGEAYYRLEVVGTDGRAERHGLARCPAWEVARLGTLDPAR